MAKKRAVSKTIPPELARARSQPGRRWKDLTVEEEAAEVVETVTLFFISSLLKTRKLYLQAPAAS